MAQLPRIFADAPIAQDIPDARLGLGAALAPGQALERRAVEVGQLGLQAQHMGVSAMLAKQKAARPIEARKLYADALDEINVISENLRMNPNPWTHANEFNAHFDAIMQRTLQKTNDPKIQEWLQEHLLTIKPERMHQERQFENRTYLGGLELEDLETQRRLIDQAARAPSDGERGKIMSEIVKMNAEQVRSGRRTPEQGMARIESAAEQVGSTQILDLIRTNPAVAQDMLEKGIGPAALLKPKRREELLTRAESAWNLRQAHERQARLDVERTAEKEANRVSDANAVALWQRLDEGQDPIEVEHLMYELANRGAINQTDVGLIRTAIDKTRKEAPSEADLAAYERIVEQIESGRVRSRTQVLGMAQAADLPRNEIRSLMAEYRRHRNEQRTLGRQEAGEERRARREEVNRARSSMGAGIRSAGMVSGFGAETVGPAREAATRNFSQRVDAGEDAWAVAAEEAEKARERMGGLKLDQVRSRIDRRFESPAALDAAFKEGRLQDWQYREQRDYWLEADKLEKAQERRAAEAQRRKEREAARQPFWKKLFGTTPESSKPAGAAQRGQRSPLGRDLRQ